MKLCLVDQELGLSVFHIALENILPFEITALCKNACIR